MTSSSLGKGANLAVGAPEVRAAFSWAPAPGGPAVRIWALLLGGDGRVLGEGGTVGGTRQADPSGRVRRSGERTVDADLAGLAPEVERILLCATAEDGGTLGQLRALELVLTDSRTGAAVAHFPIEAGRETAIVGGELYRRAGQWKFRAVGQGYATGWSGLTADYGAVEPVAPAPAPAPAVRPEPPRPEPPRVEPADAATGPEEEQALPVDIRKRLSLRKQQVAVSLQKHGAAGVRARVVLVLDASGSMSGLYRRGTVAGVVERMAAVAAQLSEDGPMPAWTFATHPARLPDLYAAELPEWIPRHVRVGELTLFGRPKRPRPGMLPGQVDMRFVGIQNEEQKVIAEVRAFVRAHPAAEPTLVLFFSDGGVYRNAAIEQELRAAVEEPVFWQFVGLGRADYGVLERFDTLPGRRVDNVGFFAVDDIDAISDPELYDRLLSEFPSWLTAARQAGILH
ncbi:stress response protein SCP2 [Streptomyces sp. TLI_235]|nr:VWA domain-containing protein [Streptomyces sp. TLI_235]PBC78526.1 stress response protein SCP2 [Streptomyces sp. TLI_235]